MGMLYLYLAARNKKGLKVIATFSGKNVKCPIRTRIENVNQLKLPAETYTKVKNIIEENRMNYECWLEEVESSQDLKDKLIKRGYSSLPNINYLIIETHEVIDINLDKQKTIKTMLRKSI